MLNDRLSEISVMRDSGLLDLDYLARTLGLDRAGVAGMPLEFLYLENKKYWTAATSALFDGRHYLEGNEDIRGAGMNPLLHYIRHGYFEGRSPTQLLDIDFILDQIDPERQSREADARGRYPIFERYAGLREMLQATDADPSPFFENAVFRADMKDRAGEASGVPIEQYLQAGGRWGSEYLECSSFASMAFYMSANSDLEAANVIPLIHLVQYGLSENRRFSPDERVSQAFLRNSAHLFGDETYKNLKGFLAGTRGTGSIAGPAWPTPYAHASIPSLRHEARKEARRAFVGVVLYENSNEEVERLKASIQNEVSISKGYDIDWAYYVNDAANESRYRKILGDRLIVDRNRENIGFGRAHNELMKRCFGVDRLYIGANPDGYFTPGCVKALTDFSDHYQGQALIEASAAPIDHPKWHDPVRLDTAWVSGACFAMPRKIWQQIGGFDESIHMYCEDVDLSWRVKLIGGLLKVCPTARFVHDVTPRFAAVKDEAKERARHRAMLAGGYYLARKWGSDEHARRLRDEFESVVGRDKLHLLQEPAVTIEAGIARKVADFSMSRFAPSRFWF